MQHALDLITARHAKRRFLDSPVPHDDLAAVLQAAAHAPSSRNTQLWRVAVVLGATRERLAARLCSCFDRGEPARPDYLNRPEALDAATGARAERATAGLLAAKGIARDDVAARTVHTRDNFRFYGAPVALIFHLQRDAAPGTFLDAGFFIQNVMLGLVAVGLASCPQYSVAGYADAIREELGLGPERLIVCGMSVGYPDLTAQENHFVPERPPLDAFVTWYGDP